MVVGRLKMILVDVEVPILNKVYDFELDENVFIADLEEEIANMISMTERNIEFDEENELLLYNVSNHQLLLSTNTLAFYDIKSGSRLLFI